MGRPKVLVASNDAALRLLIRWVQERLNKTGTTYDQVAGDVYHSRSWVSRELCGRRLPPWQLIETIATRCGASPSEAKKLWEAAETAQLRRQVRRISALPRSDIDSWQDMYADLGDLIISKFGSHRKLVSKDESGQLTRSTIGAILRRERSLSHEVLTRVLAACEVSDKEREAWMDLWERYGRPRREAMDYVRRTIAFSHLHPEIDPTFAFRESR
jgi:transcriptional regulator with XRE-family HTH domain